MRYHAGVATTVLVVGAGPTGLTLACELLRRGVGCRIIDRAERRFDRARAVDVQSRTLEVLEHVGIHLRVLELGSKLEGLGVYEGASALAHLRFDNNNTPYPFAVALSQAETEGLLEDRLTELGGHVERGVELNGLTQATGGVTTVLGTDAGTTTAHARWVVGCDGARSAVRQLTGIEVEPNGTPYTFSVADADLGWALPTNEMSLFLGGSGFVLVAPMPGGRARVIIDGEPGEPLADLGDFAAACSRRVGAPVSLRAPGHCTSYRVRGHLAKVFRVGSVVLAGDAAHTFNPVGGHGMNQGILDAYELAQELERVAQGAPPDGVLARYAERRRQSAESLQRAMDFEARLSIARAAIPGDQRSRLLELSVGCDPLRRAVLDSAVDMFRRAKW